MSAKRFSLGRPRIKQKKQTQDRASKWKKLSRWRMFSWHPWLMNKLRRDANKTTDWSLTSRWTSTSRFQDFVTTSYSRSYSTRLNTTTSEWTVRSRVKLDCAINISRNAFVSSASTHSPISSASLSKLSRGLIFNHSNTSSHKYSSGISSSVKKSRKWRVERRRTTCYSTTSRQQQTTASHSYRASSLLRNAQAPIYQC